MCKMLLKRLSCAFLTNHTQRKVNIIASCYHADNFNVYGYKARKRTPSPANDDESHSNRIKHSNIYRLVEAYRKHGHKKADLDPLGLKKPEYVPELEINRYGLNIDDTNNYDLTGVYNGSSNISISELVSQLEALYCGHLAVEFSHLESEEEREWFSTVYETEKNVDLSPERKVYLANLMLKCQAYDVFLANKFTTVKRYGGEGGESMMCIFDEIFHQSSLYGLSDIVMCMPHRGRLNLLACMLKFPPVIMFQKMKGKSELPPDSQGSGDVLSHLYTSVDLDYNDNKIHVSLIPNPSHLEANNPVAVGKARGKLQSKNSGEYSPDNEDKDDVLCVQVHGDASFSAQGVISETFSFAECPHFNVGGSVHVIVNNQIGFTTESNRGRSSRYSSDLAKINGYPVVHVNADNPEDVVKATTLAMKYRQMFKKDVIIDFICYRRWGHNEIDDPTFTQPIMYNVIQNRRSIPDLYKDKVVTEGLCKEEDLTNYVQEWNKDLSSNMSISDTFIPQAFHLKKQWSDMVESPDVAMTTWDTGMPVIILKYIGARSVQTPESMKKHATIQKTHIDRRIQRIEEGKDLDWSTAEALAFGSLLYQGYNVRISGQDVGRGTFSHRHAMIVDQVTDDIWIPLNDLLPVQTGFLEVANSSLSEEAVLGFEYGMSIENPNNLIIWEAQFGDFFNGAQIMIDTYITSGESKWLLQTGLVMLLPHGMDGAGPEHSSCRMERFLQMCDSKEDRVDSDNVNIQIANPTTPAQYFHLLRRQMIRNYRKPLVIVAPKILLRLPAATSTLSDMAPGTRFIPVLGDTEVKGEKVNKVIFCSGKHYYTLSKERENRKLDDVAIIRLESLCPFPAAEIQTELKKYSNAKDFVWSQEEHRNMGAWTFIGPRFENLIGRKLRYVGRDHLGVPATGIGDIHKSESQKLLQDSFS